MFKFLFLLIAGGLPFSCMRETPTNVLLAPVPKELRKGSPQQTVAFLSKIAGSYTPTNPDDIDDVARSFFGTWLNIAAPLSEDEAKVALANEGEKAPFTESVLWQRRANYFTTRNLAAAGAGYGASSTALIDNVVRMYLIVSTLHRGEAYYRVRHYGNIIERSYFYLTDRSAGPDNGKNKNWGVVLTEDFSKDKLMIASAYKIASDHVKTKEDAGAIFNGKLGERLFKDVEFKKDE